MIPLFRPSISSKAIKDVANIIKSGQIAFSQGGPRVRELEEKFAEYIGCRYAVAVNSGSAALYLALETSTLYKTVIVPLGEVILPSLTFVATAHAVATCGGKPVFVDIDEDTLNMSIEDLKRKITPWTKGIIPVHFAGRSCNNDEILKIASEHGLWVIDDCSHAHGSTYNGKRIGSFFNRGCFSLHPVKPVCSLGGGIITFNELSDLKEILETLRFCGVDSRTREGPFYDVRALGWNCYMTEPSAAVALDSLSRLDAEAEKRRQIARLYCESFRDIEGVEVLPYDPESTYHLFVLKLERRRDEFIQYMRGRGVETGIHYARGCHQYSYYKDPKISLPVTERVVQQLVSIPIYSGLKQDESEHIIKQARIFIGG